MNHFMLADSGEAGPNSASARYGTYAMEILINHLIKLGARRDNLEAKIFGGGRVMAALSSSNVGERNCSFVLDFLRTEGIPVIGARPAGCLSAQGVFLSQYRPRAGEEADAHAQRHPGQARARIRGAPH
jgi:chemotaxis receptor (MCP) glutamine deamidase CheD